MSGAFDFSSKQKGVFRSQEFTKTGYFYPSAGLRAQGGVVTVQINGAGQGGEAGYVGDGTGVGAYGGRGGNSGWIAREVIIIPKEVTRVLVTIGAGGALYWGYGGGSSFGDFISVGGGDNILTSSQVNGTVKNMMGSLSSLTKPYRLTNSNNNGTYFKAECISFCGGPRVPGNQVNYIHGASGGDLIPGILTGGVGSWDTTPGTIAMRGCGGGGQGLRWMGTYYALAASASKGGDGYCLVEWYE